MAGVQSVPRIMRSLPVIRPMMWDVPLEARDLAGLDQQGIARTLSGMDVPGSGIPHPQNQYSNPSVLVPVMSRLQYGPATTGSAADMIGSMSPTTKLLAAVGAVGLLYYLSKHR
jgi:hypothetical protein